MGVSKASPINWFNSGKIPGVRIGAVVRFPIEETARILGISTDALQ